MVRNNLKYSTQEIFDLISDIPDPEIPVITIAELGMLQCVEEGEQGDYVVLITPTYTACPAMKMIEEQIKERCALHGIENILVKLVLSPAWTTDWMSDATKEKLNKYGIAPPTIKACENFNERSEIVHCPQCGSSNTEIINRFGSTACKALYKCNNCTEPFEHFKCH